MRLVMRTRSTFFAGSMFGLLLVTGCINSSQPAGPSPKGPSKVIASAGLRGMIVALLANNRLIAVRATDGKVVASEAIAPTPTEGTGAGHYLAVSPDDKLLYVLSYPLANNPSPVEAVEGATAAGRGTYPVVMAT